MAKQVSPENVVGRDQLINFMWRTLKSESVVFTAERRIGKTTVLKKMTAEPIDGAIVLYADLEKVDTPIRFVEAILNDLKKHLPKKHRVFKSVDDFARSLGGTEIAGIIKLPPAQQQHWQSILEKSLSILCQEQKDQPLIFLWDEIPYMLQKIHAIERKAGSTDNSALAILDCLRARRNENKNLRMIFTGSVGLHHVLADLRGNEFASQPLNDMQAIEIGPLMEDDAKLLARNLIRAEELTCDDEAEVVDCLVHQTDAVPFYIHRVVTRLAVAEQRLTAESVEAVVKQHLVVATDPWEMEHFRERLRIYYSGSVKDADDKDTAIATIAKHLLNHIAAADSPQTIDNCHTALKSKVRIEDRDLVVEILKSLNKDHYLVRSETGEYVFRFPLVHGWWRLAEGL